MKRISFLIAVLTILSMFSGCGQQNNHENTTTTTSLSGESQSVSESVTSDTESQTQIVHKPNVPEDLNFEGHNFVIANNDYQIPIWTQRDIGAEELTGDAINDAVYNRNITIQDRYNCTIESKKIGDVAGEVRKFVNAGDNGLDIATLHLRTFPGLAQQSMLVNLNTVLSMDLSQPWYDKNSVSDLSVVKKLFGVATDFTIMDEEATTAIVFNKQLYNDLGFKKENGNIYDIIKDGKWNFDTMTNMINTVSADLNGDSVIDKNDQFGLLYQRDSLTSFLNGCNVNIATKDENDIPKITFMDENGSNMLDKIISLLYQRENCLNVMKELGEPAWSDDMIKMFANNQALFMWIRMADVENLRAINVDFGIIPVPKRDANQTEYLSSVNPYVGVVTSIVNSSYDREKVGTFIEVMSAESKNQLMPAYYEKNLQGKIARDEESSAMLDIIFQNRVYDIGQIYDIGDFTNTLIYMTMNYDADYTSKYKKTEKLINKKLSLIITTFENLE